MIDNPCIQCTDSDTIRTSTIAMQWSIRVIRTIRTPPENIRRNIFLFILPCVHRVYILYIYIVRMYGYSVRYPILGCTDYVRACTTCTPIPMGV